MKINIFYLIISIIFMLLVYNKIKKKAFSEKESFFWMTFSIFLILMSILPGLLDKLASKLHIYYPPSLLFLIAILFLAYLIFRLTETVSILNERTKELGQRNAILEKKIQDLNKESNSENGSSTKS